MKEWRELWRWRKKRLREAAGGRVRGDVGGAV